MTYVTCAVSGCKTPAREAGYCWHHWARWEAFGDPLETRRMIRKSQKARLFDRVIEDVATGCWVWIGAKDRAGYGLFHLIEEATRERTTTGAHRAAWLTLVGPIEAESLDHLCRNRACVNPGHLEPVSMMVNTHRGLDHYANKTHCKNGHEFTPENLAPRTGGYRLCRICRNEAVRKYRAKKRVPQEA